MSCLPLAKLQSACLRLKDAINRRRYRETKLKRRSIKISDPYDFQHIMKGSPNNMNEDEMNILLGRTAATRMVAMEDQAPRPPSSSTNSLFLNNSNNNHHGNGSIGSGSGHHHIMPFGPTSSTTGSSATGASRPKTPMKTRAGYRGLASSSAANGGRGLAYAAAVMPTETRPSITHSFAALEDAHAGARGSSPAASLAGSSEGSASPARTHEMRGLSI